MSKRWNVWSYDPSSGKWMVVVEGVSQKDATESLKRKRDAAAKYMPDARFQIQPIGDLPVVESNDD